jgi:hypothetical protein
LQRVIKLGGGVIGGHAEHMGEMSNSQKIYSENNVSDQEVDGRTIQSNPVITTSVYAASRLLRDIFYDTN